MVNNIITIEELDLLYLSNINTINESKDINVNSDDNKKHKIYNEVFEKTLKDFKLDFWFCTSFGTSITAFYPFVENLILNSNIIPDNIDVKQTVVLLTICALAVVFKETKESYKNLFPELRMRGVYSLLKPLVAIINIILNIFTNIGKKIGMTITTVSNMFAYTAMFVPFIMTFNDLMELSSISPLDIIKISTKDMIMKSVAIGLGILTHTTKNYITELLSKLKSFNPFGIKSIKLFIDDINNVDETDDKSNNSDDVITFTQFKDGSEPINENRYKNIEMKYGSLGDYLEYLLDSFDDDQKLEFRRLLSTYKEDLEDVNPDIRLANTINMLPEFDRRIIVDKTERITESYSDFIKDYDNNKMLGKSSFNSFIKVINALNLPNIEPNYNECPETFVLLFTFKDLNIEKVKTIIKRFKSLTPLIHIIDSLDNYVNIYFGLKFEHNKLYMEYGILSDDKRCVVGEFKLTSSNYKKMMSLNSKCLKPMQKELETLDIKDLKLLHKIKNDLNTFDPGNHVEKTNCIIKDNTLSISFYGIGSWKDGKIDDEYYTVIKDEFKNWVIKQKWKEVVLFNVKPEKFWVKFSIKVK